MKSLNTTIAILLLSSCLLVQAKKGPTIQQRLTKLEQQIKQPTEDRSSVANTVIQNQQLKREMAELRGIIEEQSHQIKNLKEKQKLLYIDIDSRLATIEANNKPATTLSSISSNSGATNNSNNDQTMTVEVDEGYDSGIQTTAINNQPALSSDQDDYDIAFAHLRAGRFLESARAFEDFIQKYPNNELTDNAYYWLGESYYVKRQYPQALAAFQTLTEKFPASRKAPDSWLKIGYSYYEMDDVSKASENLQRVINSYPNTSIARLAQNRLRQLQRDH